MLDKLRGNVCKIIINDGDEQGTGFLISNEYILTAYHVVKDFDEIEIAFVDDEPIRNVVLYKKDEKLDIAVLKLKKGVDFYQNIGFLDTPLSRKEEWKTFGYPIAKDEGEFMENISKEDKAHHIHQVLNDVNGKGYDLELNFKRKFPSYRGLSGSPLIIKNKIAGIINSELIDNTAKELNALSFNIMQIFMEEFEILNKGGIEDKMEHIHFEKLLMQIYSNMNVDTIYEPTNISKNKKNIILYSFFKIGDGIANNTNFLFISNKINQSKTIEHIEINIKQIPKNTIVVVSKKFLDDKLNKSWRTKFINLMKNLNYGEEIRFFYLDEFLSQTLLKNNLKKNNKVMSGFFINPTYKTETLQKNNDAISLLSSWIKNDENPLSVVLGEGGIGKTWLLKEFVNTINDNDTNKIALYIDANKIATKYLDYTNNMKYNLSIFSNLLKLYYMDIVSEEKNKFFMGDTQLIDILVSSGNLIIVIDGLDEIASILKEKFVFEEFINDIFSINKILGYAKVIISSRTTYWDSNIRSDEKFNLVTIKGFSEENVKDYFRKFFEDNSDDKYLLAMKELKESPFKDGDGYYWPFPVYIIADEINENEYREIFNRDIKSKYIKNKNNKNEFLIERMILRDIKRHSLSMELDDFLEIFLEIIFEHNGYMPEDDMKYYIEELLPESSRLSLSILDHNPLLSKNAQGYQIVDFLLDHFILIFLVNIIEKNKFTLNSAKILSRYHLGDNKLIKLFSEKVDNSKIKNFLKSTLLKYKGDEKNIVLEKAVSTLLYILFESSKEDMTEKLNTISNIFHYEHGIKNLFIMGKFYPLNFENQRIYNSKFINYDNFIKSRFNEKSYFIDSKIHFNDELKEKKNQNLNHKIFDNTCSLSDNLKSLLATKDTKEIHKDKIKTDVKMLLRNFFKGEHHNAQNRDDIKFKTSSSIKFDKLLKEFIGKNIIDDKTRTPPYNLKITDEYRDSILQFIGNDYLNAQLDNFINELAKKYYS